MRWSRAIICFLAIGLPLVSAHPVSAASASLDQRSAKVASTISSIQVPTPNGRVPEKDDKTRRRGTLVTRNDEVVLLENEVAYLDPKGKNSKVYLTSKQGTAELGKRPKSDKTLKTTVAVRTSQLGPCFALAIVNDAKGGLLGHYSPPFCRWLEDPKSEEENVVVQSTYAKAALIKLLSKQYKSNLDDSEVYIIHGPSAKIKARDLHERVVKEILSEGGIEDKVIRRIEVPEYAGEPGSMDDETFAKRKIYLEQQPDRRLRLRMGDQVITG